MIYRCQLTFGFAVQANSLEEAEKSLREYASLDGAQLQEYAEMPAICPDEVQCSDHMACRPPEDLACEPETRRCSNCGKPMKEGYYLAGEYACSTECCLALYGRDEAQMREDLSHADEDCGECYYTEWESEYFD